jgi:uncharacterized membrane protein
LAGLVVVIPIAATMLVLKFLYTIISGFFDPLVKAFVKDNRDSLPDFIIVNDTIPFAALMITILLIFLMGLLVTNVFGRKFLHYLENLLLRVPLVNVIYPLAKQVVDSIKRIGESATHPEPGDNRQVVYLRYPNLNGYLIAFQTGRFKDKKGEEFVSVFIPTAPNPITGFVLIFKEDDIIESDLAMEDAWKLLVSAGFVTPLAGEAMPSPHKTTIEGIVPAPGDTTQKD